MNYPAMSLYAQQHAPWVGETHHPRCPWNADSRGDRKVPTHQCGAGHYFNADDLPALEATVNRLTECPLFHLDDHDYDDGPCHEPVLELECWCESPDVP